MSRQTNKNKLRAGARKIDKVLLFRSPLAYHSHVGHEDPHPPLELLLLAAALRNYVETRVLDGQSRWRQESPFGRQRRMGLSDGEILAEATKFSPDLIGISVTWHNQVPMALHCAGLLRAALPNAVIVVGGIAPSSSPEVFLASDAIDFVIAGYGERSFPLLCQYLSRGGDLSQVPGLYRRDGSAVVGNQKSGLFELDSVPFPAFDLIDLSHYDSGYLHGHHKAFPVAGYLPTRGCTHSCTFCSLPAVSDKIFRSHSLEKIIDDLRRMKNEFGIREVHFYDDNLLQDPAFAKKLFQEIILASLDLPWLAEAGFAMWQIDEEILELARESGMYRLDLPIEAGSDRVRENIMNKGLYKNDGVSETIQLARKVGIERVYGYVIVGSPGETLGDIRATLDFFRQLDLDYRGVRFAQPFPGTLFHKICTENGYLAHDFELSRLWFDIANIQTDDFSVDEVTAMVAAYRAAALIQEGRYDHGTAMTEIAKNLGQHIADAACRIVPTIPKPSIGA